LRLAAARLSQFYISRNVRLHDSIIPAATTAAAAVLLLLTFAKLAARTDINKLMNGKGEPTNYISWCGAATLNEGEISSATR
jgi:hypothetical protein